MLITRRKIPKQQRSRELVTAILQAAARILENEDQPFTTNHIAKLAGVSIGSLYQYFPNAETIMAALIEEHIKEEIDAAEAILVNCKPHSTETLRELTIAFVNAHASSPKMTAKLHSLAPSFGLQQHLTNSRNAQATRIAEALGLPKNATQISAMAVEGVVLATLARDPEMLATEKFIDQLLAIAMAPLNLE